jgi:hypothetical protein
LTGRSNPAAVREVARWEIDVARFFEAIEVARAVLDDLEEYLK